MILDSCVHRSAFEPIALGCSDSKWEHRLKTLLGESNSYTFEKITALEGMFGLFHGSQDGIIEYIKVVVTYKRLGGETNYLHSLLTLGISNNYVKKKSYKIF